VRRNDHRYLEPDPPPVARPRRRGPGSRAATHNRNTHNQEDTVTNLCATGCGRPVADTGYLCHSDNNSCTALTAGHLEYIANTASELDVTITRRDKLGDGTGRSNETPLPFNEDAAAAARDIHDAIATIAGDIAAARGLALADDPLRAAWIRANTTTPRRSPQQTAAAARYIKTHLRWLRCQPRAGAAALRIQEVARQLTRAIDSHPVLTDLGPCGNDGCEGRLLAGHGDRYARCRDGCGWVASVAETTGLLLDWARDQLFTADELSSLISKWHTRRRVPPGTIRSWAARGLLPRKGKAGRAWLYNLGDAIDLADRLIPTTTEQELAA
jgi:hypothetical protein